MKIPTAEEMFNANPILPEGVERQACISFMKTFTKLHVKAALKAASENAEIESERIVTLGGTRYEDSVNKDSILNAYPLTNIK